MRRFNYTGRVRIPRESLVLTLVPVPDGGSQAFIADLSGLATFAFDPTARVVVEAHVRQSSMRFDFGSIGEPAHPDSTALTELDEGTVPQFKVKIVDTRGRPGRLLGLAEHIRPVDADGEDDSRRSILPLYEVDLGQAIWRLEVGHDNPPALLINKRIDGLKARLLDDPVLGGAVFPEAARSVLAIALHPDIDSELEWVADWREFASNLLRRDLSDLPDDEDRALAIEETITKFSELHMWSDRAQPRRGFEDSDYE